MLLHSLLLYFFGNRCIVNDHSYAAVVVAAVVVAAVVVAVIIVSRRTAVSTAFPAGSLFIILLVSRGVYGDNAESVAQVGRVCVKRVLARCAHHLVSVLLLE